MLIDKVLAEGCPISKQPHDLAAMRARIDQTRKSLEEEQAKLKSGKQALGTITSNLWTARQELIAAENALQTEREKQRLARLAWRDASALVQNIERLATLESEHSGALAAAELPEKAAVDASSAARHARREADAAIRAFSDRFDAVVAYLLDGEARGGVYFTDNGLMRLNVELGGSRDSTAIGILKVLAFDFSALTLSIEGRAAVLPFLLHDSPREADMQPSLYARIFDLARELETFGAKPLFQYIITTTTAPPPEAQTEPYLRLTIRGSPAKDRLLGVDL